MAIRKPPVRERRSVEYCVLGVPISKVGGDRIRRSLNWSAYGPTPSGSRVTWILALSRGRHLPELAYVIISWAVPPGRAQHRLTRRWEAYDAGCRKLNAPRWAGACGASENTHREAGVAATPAGGVRHRAGTSPPRCVAADASTPSTKAKVVVRLIRRAPTSRRGNDQPVVRLVLNHHLYTLVPRHQRPTRQRLKNTASHHVGFSQTR